MRGVAAKVPLAPLGKVTAFSVVYGVLFLASIIGEFTILSILEQETLL